MSKLLKIAATTTVAVFIATALSACGGPGRDTPAHALVSAYTTLQSGDAQKFCDDFITAEGQGMFALFTDGCAEAMAEKNIPQGEITIDDSLIEVDGDKATARQGALLVDGEPAGNGWTMVKQGGRWFLITYL